MSCWIRCRVRVTHCGGSALVMRERVEMDDESEVHDASEGFLGYAGRDNRTTEMGSRVY